MSLMKYISFIFNVNLPKPEIFCKVFECNKSCIAVAQQNKFSQITKHISIKYRHLQILIQKNINWICCIVTREQTSIVFNKTLDEALFIYLQRLIH